VQIEVAPRRKRSVSLTPLIDVVFNLLLFFMLASSLAQWSGLELATGSETASNDDIPAADIYLLGDGEFRYDEQTYPLQALAEQLTRDLEAERISSVILRAEDGVRLHELIDSFDQLGHAGIQALALGETAD
jgi:biopolymer transport protein ExbD|tara:strand:+ start:1338 stop:1733 length:396 start_codon:yes stop_codon:yes gene_type:complete